MTRPRWQRVVGWAAVLLSVLLLATSGALYLLYRHYDGRIGRVDVPGLAEREAEDRNYLLVGSDSRDGLTAAELDLLRTTQKPDGPGTLTDTILLVHVPADGDAARFVSFPRDSLVDIPGIGTHKINSAYQRGESQVRGSGPATLVQTVAVLTGLSIDHYVEVNLLAFLRITDAVGGVPVDLCDDVRESNSGINLRAGPQLLDGPDALSFVRQRTGLVNELDRIERQQYFIGRLAAKVLSSGTLLSPSRVTGLLGATTDSLRTDEGLSARDLTDLALRLRGVAAGDIEFETVPVGNVDARVRGESVVLLDMAALPAFFRSLSSDEKSQPASPQPQPQRSTSPGPVPSPTGSPPRTAADTDCID